MRTSMRTGSPPHTRGKAPLLVASAVVCRITPAHAGKRTLTRDIIITLKDHPRTRGEKSFTFLPDGIGEGSPPHTRGKVHAMRGLRRGGRITPAHAGKRWIVDILLRQVWDHPRTRGEKFKEPSELTLRTGSPPHTRGKAHISSKRSSQTRITPAHAGKSLESVCVPMYD